MEDLAFKKNIKGVVAKIFKIQWHTMIQEIVVRSLQQNQGGTIETRFGICESAKQEIRKQEVERLSSVTKREFFYRKFRKIKPTKFDGFMDLDGEYEWIDSI